MTDTPLASALYAMGRNYAYIHWYNMVPYSRAVIEDTENGPDWISGYYDFWKSKNFKL